MLCSSTGSGFDLAWFMFFIFQAQHSIILASCKPGCKPGFPPGLQPGFRQVRAGLRLALDFFCRKPGREPAASIPTCRYWCSRFAAGLLVRARAIQIECKKNPFRACQRICWTWIFVTYFIIRAYRDVITWKSAMKKSWFYTQKRYKLRP